MNLQELGDFHSISFSAVTFGHGCCFLLYEGQGEKLGWRQALGGFLQKRSSECHLQSFLQWKLNFTFSWVKMWNQLQTDLGVLQIMQMNKLVVTSYLCLLICFRILYRKATRQNVLYLTSTISIALMPKRSFVKKCSKETPLNWLFLIGFNLLPPLQIISGFVVLFCFFF